MVWLVSEIAQVAIIALVAILIVAMLSPFESLQWWAGWDDRWSGPAELPALSVTPVDDQANCYIVYLSGVGSMDPSTLNPKESNFLDLLQERLVGEVLLRDVFPYSVTNNPLTGRRRLGAFWRWAQRAVERFKNLVWLITTRNLFQVAVSADRRYGPIYSFGIAREITLSLVRHGYRFGSGIPIVIIGLSGGGQIAVGCTPSLARILDARVWVVSIGGVLTDDPGILAVEHVYHLSGSKDAIQHVGARLYPGRWPIFKRSAWNRARAQGIISVIAVGPMKHMGQGDYFSRSARLPDGRSHVEKTVDVVAAAIDQIRAQLAAVEQA